MPKIVTKRMQFVFQFSFFWKEKCHVQSPDPLCPLKLHETVCRSSQSLVLFFFFFLLAFFVCISMSLIHPFHCLEFHQPGLTCLYTQWHTVSKVSPHTIFLRFSRQDCHCWFVSVEQETHRTDLPSLFCLPQSFLGQTFCTLGEIIGSSGSRLERVLS